MITKERVILSLFGIAAALLILNIFIKNKPPEVIRDFPDKISRAKCDSILISELNGFGLNEKWYERISVNNSNFDSLKHVFHVNVPSDLPLIELLGELQKVYSEYDVQLKISERKQYREADIKFYLDGYFITQAIFKRDASRSRSVGKLRLIVVNDGGDFEGGKYLNMPFNLDIALIPSIDNALAKDSIIACGKGFVVLINDQISDADYLLDENLGKRKLKSSVNKICSDFESAREFIIDDRSVLYNSISYNLVRDQFRANKIYLKNLSSYSKFSEGNRFDQQSRFRFLLDNLKSGEDKTLIIHDEALPNLRKEIDRAIKLGVKFVK